MKILFSATAVAALALATSAFAGDWRSNDYAQINIGSGVAGTASVSVSGVGSQSIDLNPGFLGGGLVGHSFGNGVSVEGEILYNQNELKDAGARIETFGGLANLKYEVPTHYKVMETSVSPYVAGGVGYGSSKLSSSGLSASKDGLLWQVKAGLALHQSDRVTWDIGYRYLQLADYDLGGGVKVDAHTHGITVGLRWGF